MPKIVQLNRGTREQIDAYVGPEGEVTAVTDTFELRLHDGMNPGGHEFWNLSSLDLRFQMQSPRLESIADLSEPGFLMFDSSGVIVTKGIAGRLGEIEVDQPAGVGGIPTIGLPAVVTKALTFDAGLAGNLTGDVTGNLQGDVTGNLTGDVTGNVTGDIAGTLTGDSAGTHIGPQVGDVDVRSATLQLDDAQIPLSAIDAPVVTSNDLRLLPVGVIMAWSGSAASIPAGWTLCDGSDGTPDLRDRFVIGAQGTHAVDDTGGATTHTHGTLNTADAGGHTHGLSVDPTTLTIDQIPSHLHRLNLPIDKEQGALNGGVPFSFNWRTDVDKKSATLDPFSEAVGGGQGHSHSGTAASAGVHSHSVTIGALSHMPPFYALAFIMFTGV